MKRLSVLLLFLLFITIVQAAATVLRDTLPLFDSAEAAMYNNRATGQAGAGALLLMGGTISSVVGYGIIMDGLSHLFDRNYSPKKESLAKVLGFGGLALAAAGIILLKASKNNKRKAEIILSNQDMTLTRQVFGTKTFVTFGVAIKI